MILLSTVHTAPFNAHFCLPFFDGILFIEHEHLLCMQSVSVCWANNTLDADMKYMASHNDDLNDNRMVNQWVGIATGNPIRSLNMCVGSLLCQCQ